MNDAARQARIAEGSSPENPIGLTRASTSFSNLVRSITSQTVRRWVTTSASRSSSSVTVRGVKQSFGVRLAWWSTLGPGRGLRYGNYGPKRIVELDWASTRAQNRSMSRVELLMATMDEGYARLRSRLVGLGDEEFSWLPVPEAWTIYKDRRDRWTYNYAVPDPDPAPLTTIGWQLVHLGTCKVMYHEWAYGAARLTFHELEIPHTASGALSLLEEGQRQLRNDLLGTSELQLDGPRKTNWGEMWPAWRIFWAMIDHDALHGGVIGCLRDLYCWTRDSSARC